MYRFVFITYRSESFDSLSMNNRQIVRFLKPLLSTFALLVLFFIQNHALAQEFNVTVDLNTSQISSSEFNYLNELRTLIKEYIEDRRWTDDNFQEDERIEVRLNIVITSADNNANFDANLIVQAFRPIYNTNNKSLLVRLNDSGWQFNFPRGRTIMFDPFQFDDIASVLDFYMFVILGYDYDSFSELGGTPFFQQAQNILNVAQSGGGGAGWSSSGSRRSRHNLITQLNDQRYEGLRRANYLYHRMGLDRFTLNTDAARSSVMEAFELLRETQRQVSDLHLFSILFSSKYREFTAVFVDADLNQRLEAYNLLVDMDNSHVSEYDKLQ